MIRLLPMLLAAAVTSGAPAVSPVLPVRIVSSSNPTSIQRYPAQARPNIHPLSAADSLAVIAQLPPALWGEMAFGDTDHDGLYEAVLELASGTDFSYAVFEHQGYDVYSEVYRNGVDLIPYAVGDLDGDGKAEIIGQSGFQIHVYESIDANSYPSQLVWSSPDLSNVLGSTAIADTDRDGRMEIIHSVNFGTYLVIFENRGDNTFEQVYSAYTGDQDDGPKVIADLDGDGWLEIAFGGTYGVLHIFEPTANDSWTEIFTEQTELWNAYGMAGGRDADGNGRREIFMMGYSSEGAKTIVYEATGNNQFARAAEIVYPGAWGYTNGCGDLDGQGREEYLTRVRYDTLVAYRATSPGQWVPVLRTVAPDHAHTLIHLFDVNRNGRWEVFWTTDDRFESTLVYEYRTLPTSTEGSESSLSFKVTPNPCRGEARVEVAPLWRALPLRIGVFDAAGRLMERRVLAPGIDSAWPVQALPAGTYFLRLEDPLGATLATRRVVVLR